MLATTMRLCQHRNTHDLLCCATFWLFPHLGFTLIVLALFHVPA